MTCPDSSRKQQKPQRTCCLSCKSSPSPHPSSRQRDVTALQEFCICQDRYITQAKKAAIYAVHTASLLHLATHTLRAIAQYGANQPCIDRTSRVPVPYTGTTGYLNTLDRASEYHFSFLRFLSVCWLFPIPLSERSGTEPALQSALVYRQ